MVFETFSEKETYELGKKFGENSLPGDIFCLEGELGVGKTAFSKGFADGLEIKETICSPTYTIIQTYEDGRIPFYHFDVYRISDIYEMDEIGFDDYIFGKGVCLIEWASRIEPILPKNSKIITIEKNLEKGFEYRRIIIK